MYFLHTLVLLFIFLPLWYLILWSFLIQWADVWKKTKNGRWADVTACLQNESTILFTFAMLAKNRTIRKNNCVCAHNMRVVYIKTWLWQKSTQTRATLTHNRITRRAFFSAAVALVRTWFPSHDLSRISNACICCSLVSSSSSSCICFPPTQIHKHTHICNLYTSQHTTEFGRLTYKQTLRVCSQWTNVSNGMVDGESLGDKNEVLTFSRKELTFDAYCTTCTNNLVLLFH